MTTQIQDSFIYNDESYSVIASNLKPEFNPRKYGFRPKPAHTACYSGYYCEYAVCDGWLRLDSFHVCQENRAYSEPEKSRPRRPRKFPDLFGVKALGPEDDDSFHHYLNLNHVMECTGSLLIGNDQRSDAYSGLWCNSDAFNKVLELKFESGRLMESKDHSDLISELRRLRMDEYIARFRKEVPSVDYFHARLRLMEENNIWWMSGCL